jgi:hypothetical protein
MRRALIIVAAFVLSLGGVAAVAQAAPSGNAAGAASGASSDELPPLEASNPGPQTSTVGVAVSPVQLRCYHQYLYCFWKFTGLPPGIAFNYLIQLTGTPTTAGRYTVEMTVKDTQNRTTTESFTWTINP